MATDGTRKLPKPGDAAVCAYCAEIHIFRQAGSRLVCRRLPESEMRLLPDALQRDLKWAQNVVRTLRHVAGSSEDGPRGEG